MAARKAKKARKPANAAKAKRPTPRASAPVAVPPAWRLDRGGKSMSRTVETEDFLEAVGLVNAIAPVAEEIQHHPDLHIEEWNKLRVTTWSHDVGRLTDRDERLARRVDEVLRERGF